MITFMQQVWISWIIITFFIIIFFSSECFQRLIKVSLVSQSNATVKTHFCYDVLSTLLPDFFENAQITIELYVFECKMTGR